MTSGNERKQLRRAGLILGLIGAGGVTVFWYWLTISFAAGKQVDLVEWLLVAAIGLYVISSVAAAWKWPLAGGAVLSLEGLTLTGWFITGCIWGSFDISELLILLPGLSFIASEVIFLLSWREGRKHRNDRLAQ